MNEERRAWIRKAQALIDEAQGILMDCQGEEQTYFDNMPEAIQAGSKGYAAQEAIDALENAVGDLGDIDLSEALA